MFCWVLNTPLEYSSVNYFHQKLHLNSLIEAWICNCLYWVRQFWKYKIIKAYYKETQKNCNKRVLFIFGNSCLNIFVSFQEKHPREITFLNKALSYLKRIGVSAKSFYCSSLLKFFTIKLPGGYLILKL